MKKLFIGMALACGMALAAADPYFDATIKHVDQGGEMLDYQNVSSLTVMLNKAMAYLAAESGEVEAQRAVAFFSKLLDITSIKAQAQSSVKIEPMFYVYKGFTFIDPAGNSILMSRSVRDTELNFLDLPADTLLAVYANINLGEVWKRVTDEINANPDKEMVKKFNDMLADAKKDGVDINAIAESIDGQIMILIAGENVMAPRIFAAIPDRTGALSAALNRKFPPAAGSSAYPLPAGDVMPNAQMIYSKNCVLFVSDPKVLEKPAQTLAANPRFAKYASKIAGKGVGYVVMNIPPQVASFANAMMPEDAAKMIKVKPFSFAAVNTISENGLGVEIASSFSIPQLPGKFLIRTTVKSARDDFRKARAAKAKAAEKPADEPTK